MKVIFPLMLCLGLISFIGCSPQAPVEPEEPTQPRYVGQINSVHAEQGFVLIRRGAGVTLSPGMILISRGPGERVANLRVSGESLGQMVAADIQSGQPQIGDSVHEPLLDNPELTPDPETPSTPE